MAPEKGVRLSCFPRPLTWMTSKHHYAKKCFFFFFVVKSGTCLPICHIWLPVICHAELVASGLQDEALTPKKMK